MAEDENRIKKRKRRQTPAIYGNYMAYYGYRIDNKLGEDPRLKVLKKEWFEGKDCLDIGCNMGLVTISIATVSPALVKQLRDETGAGMMDCKKALSETGGGIVKAQEFLRKKGLASADKKANRATAKGRIGCYIHDNRIGILIEIAQFRGKIGRFGDLTAQTTIGIMNPAKKFCCRSILGIDIDARLVECANVNLRNEARCDVHSQLMMSSKSEDSKCVEDLDHSVVSSGTSNFTKDLSALDEGNLLDRVSFRKENFVESSKACLEEYDTIICLSVTKWVHLNWGDDGLITLFAKIWKLLRPSISQVIWSSTLLKVGLTSSLQLVTKQPLISLRVQGSLQYVRYTCKMAGTPVLVKKRTPDRWDKGYDYDDDNLADFISSEILKGGILILEPQPWKSYKNCYRVSETANYNFKNILFTPGIFQEILLDKIGFRTVEKLTDNLEGSAPGFNRPIFAFFK